MNKNSPFSQCICYLCLFVFCLCLLGVDSPLCPRAARAAGLGQPLKPELITGWNTNSQPRLGANQFLEAIAETASVQDRVLQKAPEQNAELQRLIAAIQYDEAQKLGEPILAERIQVLGPEHPEVATVLTRLATIHRNKGDFAKALSLNQRALTIAERMPAPGHPELGQIVNEMGVIYFRQDKWVLAEPEFVRALDIWKHLGPTHPNNVRATGNLAAVRGARNDFAKAKELLQRALGATERVVGMEDPRLVNLLIGLGAVYFEETVYLGGNDFAQAEQFYQRAVKILETTLGKPPGQKPPPAYPGALSTMAAILTIKGEFVQAEALHRRALAIRENIFPPGHPEIADSLALLAINHSYQGRFAEAETLQQQALGMTEKTLGPEHPNVAGRLNSLTRIYTAQGDFAKAVTTQMRATEVSEHGLAYNLTAGSEREKLAYLSTFANETDRTISLHLDFAPKDRAARSLALTTVLRRKARALDSMIDSLAILRKRALPEDRALLDKLQTTRAQIAQLVIQPLPSGTNRADQQARLRELNEQREKLEDQISRSSAEFRAQSQPVTLAAIQAAIPDRAALVEFTVYRPYNPKFTKPADQFGAPRYAAYVLHRAGAARWANLGDKRAIDDAVEKLRQALRDRKRRDVKRLAHAVDKLVMQRLRPLLGPVRHLLVAPDGSLNLVPFAALVDERSRYLVQRYTFSYLSSGRDLLRLSVKAPRQRTALIVTNPDFGPDAGNLSAGSTGERILRYRSPTPEEVAKGSILADAYFPPLPGTADEALAIKNLLPEAELLTLKQATETTLKLVNAPDILHVATHGFFLGDLSEGGQRGLLLDPDVAVRATNPLLRSGLALAGANQLALASANHSKSSEDDGILTALEAAGLNLWGTRLVVLSACDTGVGEVKNGEGVYGLRRALLLAGSETQVMSLWPVSDRGTRDLMIDYYRRLQQGGGRAEALRAAQLHMLSARAGQGASDAQRIPKRKDIGGNVGKGHDYTHPYYWASFIQSGEWANLDGKR